MRIILTATTSACEWWKGPFGNERQSNRNAKRVLLLQHQLNGIRISKEAICNGNCLAVIFPYIFSIFLYTNIIYFHVNFGRCGIQRRRRRRHMQNIIIIIHTEKWLVYDVESEIGTFDCSHNGFYRPNGGASTPDLVELKIFHFKWFTVRFSKRTTFEHLCVM